MNNCVDDEVKCRIHLLAPHIIWQSDHSLSVADSLIDEDAHTRSCWSRQYSFFYLFYQSTFIGN